VDVISRPQEVAEAQHVEGDIHLLREVFGVGEQVVVCLVDLVNKEEGWHFISSTG
jgi:hypothetical protein